MEIDLVYGGATIHVSGVDEPRSVHSRHFSSQEHQIRDALERLPRAHCRLLPPITIGDRPASGGGYYRTPPHIGLNRRTFVAEHNRQFLFTLIHECGHAVDFHTNALAQFIARCGGNPHRGAPGNADWDAYRAIRYRGRNKRPDGTPAFGEHFAEGYAHLLTRPSRLDARQQRIIRRMAGM